MSTPDPKPVERQIRFPRPVYGRLKRSAKINRRSANAELLIALEEYLDRREAERAQERREEAKADGK